MSKTYGSRKALAVLLLVLGLAPGPLAAQQRSAASGSLQGWMQQAWSWLVSAWQTTEAGARLDPFGQTSNAGMQVDPDGQTSEAGMQADPFGNH
jgi:hypothetical protein